MERGRPLMGPHSLIFGGVLMRWECSSLVTEENGLTQSDGQSSEEPCTIKSCVIAKNW